ncbi:MAG: beta strand repeat-containing protein, partial [Pyrinomonadaceae bacterium]
MNKTTPGFASRRFRASIATLLAYFTLLSPLAPVAAQTVKVKRASAPAEQSAQQAGDGKGSATGGSKQLAPPAPNTVVGPIITATKTDSFPDPDNDGFAVPGAPITYTVTISNTGTADATGVVFSDTVDTNTTVVSGSSAAAKSDSYNTIGNVPLSVPAPGVLANDQNPDTNNNSGMTVNATPTSSANCTGSCSNNVVLSSDGSFTYDPPVGFTGTDTFTYTANAGGSAQTTVKITVANKIWFVNNASSCLSNCDGRLSHPFTTLAAFQAINDGGAAATHAKAGDAIFLYESATAYTGPVTLLANQKFIGQDATASLITITGFTQPSGTDPLPAMAPANGTIVNITTTVAATNAITVSAGGDLLRGFTVGNTTGAKIFGNNFGTLTVGNSASPDVTLNGTGQALNLTTGTLSVAGGFASVATTSSTGTGITLAGVADSDGAGGSAFSFGSTTVSGSTTQGILVGTTTADINFGNTAVGTASAGTGGTDAISLQNNSAGTRTFGTITTQSNSGVGFLHGAGGGAVSVTGATTITNPTGNGIDIDSSNANISFAATTVNKGSTSNTGVDLTANATRTISFSSLTVTTTNGFALNANNSGTVNVTTGSLTQSGAGGGAASLTNTVLGLTFTSVSSNNGGNGLLFSGGSGTFTSGTTNLQNNAGIGLSMSSTAVAANFGNTTVNSSAGDAVDLSSNTANITFALLDLSPDSGLRGLDATSNTGTITSTSGTISTTNAAAVNVSGVSAASLSPLSLVLTSVSATVAAATVASGVSLTNTGGTVTMNGGAITGGNAAAFNVFGGNANITYKGNVSQANAQRVVNVDSTTGGTVAFNTGTVTSTGSSTGININAANGNVSFTGYTHGTGVAARLATQAVTITGGTGTYSLGALNIFTNNVTGVGATNADGTINSTSGTVDSSNGSAVSIDGPAGLTTLGMALTRVDSAGGSADGISIQDTNGSFTVAGSGGTCTNANTSGCTGGTISSKTGADGNTVGTGVFANNATNISLTRMHLNDFSNYAIRGTTVTGFTLQNSTLSGVNGSSTAADEGTIIFDGLFGTSTFSSNDIRGSIEDNFRVRDNTSGTANDIIISNNTISGAANDNLIIECRGTSNCTTHITGNTFSVANGDHVQTVVDNSATMNLVLNGNFYSGGDPTSLLQGFTISGGSDGSSETFNFDISNNGTAATPLTGNIQGGAINVNKGNGNGNWQGRVNNNFIGNAAVALSGSAQAGGIRVENHADSGALTALITNNTIRQWASGPAINTQVGEVGNATNTGTLNVTVTGNSGTNPGPGTQHGFVANIGAANNASDTSVACVDVRTNTLDGNAVNGGAGLRLRLRGAATIRIPGYTGGSADAAAIAAYVDGLNLAALPKPAQIGTGGAGYFNTVPAGSACAQPTVPTSPVVIGDLPAPENAQSSVAQQTAVNDITSRPFVSLPQAAKPAKGQAQGLASAQLGAQAPVSKTDGGGKTSSTKSPAPVFTTTSTNITVTIGTLAAGDSVTITWQVTIGDPLPSGVTQVSNQGTVSGSNFSNVLTDDPSVAGSNNPTVTPILTPPDIRVNDAKVAEPTSGTS